MITLQLCTKSLALGCGLAMDAFSVSLTNGLSEPKMKPQKVIAVAGIFAFFQALMPFLGWACVDVLQTYLSFFPPLIPWIALCLLVLIGGKMLIEGLKSRKSCALETKKVTPSLLLTQAVATSIDALSTGFTVSEYHLTQALLCVTLIAAVTFVICISGVLIGKKFGMSLSGYASVVGGIILIVIGVQVWLRGIL